MSVPRAKLALLSCVLLLCIAAGSRSALAQTAARPAATVTPTPANIHARVTERVVDATTPDDAAVDKMLGAYTPKVRALDLVIGKLKGDLKKGSIGAGSLGSFVTDGIRAQASLRLGKPVALAVTNGGGLRKNAIAEGDLRTRDIFELLPFENVLIAFDLTGAQLLDLLKVVVATRDAQSGARVTYRINADKKAELERARLLVDGQEKEIDPAAIYTVICIDYLLKVKGDYAVLQQAKAMKPLGLTIRDAIIDYVKAETAAGHDIKPPPDGRYRFDKANSAVTEEVRPQ